jgi:hypothetical protein
MAIVLNALSTLLDGACSGTRQNHPVSDRQSLELRLLIRLRRDRNFVVTEAMFPSRHGAMAFSLARLGLIAATP